MDVTRFAHDMARSAGQTPRCLDSHAVGETIGQTSNMWTWANIIRLGAIVIPVGAGLNGFAASIYAFLNNLLLPSGSVSGALYMAAAGAFGGTIIGVVPAVLAWLGASIILLVSRRGSLRSWPLTTVTAVSSGLLVGALMAFVYVRPGFVDPWPTVATQSFGAAVVVLGAIRLTERRHRLRTPKRPTNKAPAPAPTYSNS